jgi:MFS transporter, UMF1 family
MSSKATINESISLGDSSEQMIQNESAGGVEEGLPMVHEEETASKPKETSKVLRHELSISEAAGLSHGGWNAPLALRWFEIPFQIRDSVDRKKLPEVTGWAMDSAARGPLNQMGGFIGAAVLRLATVDAGCKAVRTCENTVLGLKPSSLLTLSSAIVGVVTAILMPLVGATIDHSRFRKEIAVLSAIVCVGLTGVLISISEERNNWTFILCIDAIQTFCLKIHTTATFAYLPDLTTNETVLAHYTSNFTIRQFMAQILFTVLLITAGVVHGTNKTVASSVFTAKTAAGMAFGYSFILLGYAWSFLFRKRPPLSEVPDGQSFINTGFIQLQKTTRKIWSRYHALRWFLISLLWSPEAGAGVVLAIAVSFFTVELNFSGQNLAIVTLILMVGNCFGAVLSKFLCGKINALNTYRSGFVFLAVVIGATVAYVDGPDKVNACYGFSSMWGLAMGWIYPAQRVLFCTLIPKGQETEMMGLFAFASQILGWLPPLLVTILNQNSINLRYGMLVVSGFSMLAVTCTLPMGSYAEATSLVARDSEEKLKQVLIATRGTNHNLPQESSEVNDDNRK